MRRQFHRWFIALVGMKAFRIPRLLQFYESIHQSFKMCVDIVVVANLFPSVVNESRWIRIVKPKLCNEYFEWLWRSLNVMHRQCEEKQKKAFVRNGKTLRETNLFMHNKNIYASYWVCWIHRRKTDANQFLGNFSSHVCRRAVVCILCKIEVKRKYLYAIYQYTHCSSYTLFV